jgi:hypothetical protein
VAEDVHKQRPSRLQPGADATQQLLQQQQQQRCWYYFVNKKARTRPLLACHKGDRLLLLLLLLWKLPLMWQQSTLPCAMRLTREPAASLQVKVSAVKCPGKQRASLWNALETTAHLL